MKNILIIAAAFAMIAGVASCKNDYECCYIDSNGTKLGPASGDLSCSTSSLSKKEAEDLEAENTATAAAAFNGTAECEKK
ncbi:MAG: hypothetical protein ACJASM_000608 [Salibacteraceae bacterium]|jgi:hypothetical protein|tara:strand:+ start:273 stop:512 length:240 start_codon:yes stop_codon:yes gene_type:complete